MALDGLPSWLVQGTAWGLLATAAVLVVYLLGHRFFRVESAGRRTYDPDEVRRLEVRRYLARIGEPAREDATVAGETVDFWLSERGVAITFDARTFLALRRRDVVAVLLEHEVPGHRIGHRLPFDTPEIRAEPAPADELRWAYGTLGVGPDAGPAEVDAAYRERILEVHPDQGGDSDALGDVLRAYEVLQEPTAARR